jgi:ABC-type Na+ efflux pump permease subunit
MSNQATTSSFRATIHAALGLLLVLSIGGWVLNLLDWGYRLAKGGVKELEGQLLHVMGVTFGVEYATLPHALMFAAAFFVITIALLIGFLRTRSGVRRDRGEIEGQAP